MANQKTIYKILQRDLWAQALADGVFAGAEIDLQDGYIHFSASHQVKETANKHFAGVDNLVLVAFDAAQFGESLKWEVSRGGERFPHLYGTLNPVQAVFVEDLSLDQAGEFQFPELNRE